MELREPIRHVLYKKLRWAQKVINSHSNTHLYRKIKLKISNHTLEINPIHNEMVTISKYLLKYGKSIFNEQYLKSISKLVAFNLCPLFNFSYNDPHIYLSDLLIEVVTMENNIP